MPEHPLVSRRTAVLGVAATYLLAGCDHGDDIGEPTPTGGGSPSSASTPGSTPTPELTADEELVLGVNAALMAAVSVLARARRVPLLRPVVVPFIQAHRRHQEVLADGPQPKGPPATADEAPPGLGELRKSEQTLRAALVDAASRAESGSLAKLLASMAASTTQHLDSLPGKA